MENQTPFGSSPQGQPQPLNKNLVIVCLTVIVISAMISGVVLLKKPSTGTVGQNQQQEQPEPTGPVKVSVDDDAVLGDKNAPLTMIEFSDYECPFCKRHAEQVHPEIKRDYIDTGKLKLIFRDFVAVPSHNPLATSEAMAAECAADQGGDAVYYKYHDELFKRTTSNGNGLTLAQLSVIAKDLGLNASTFQSCLDSNKYKSEVEKDMADAKKALPANNQGTPSFFVGRSTSSGVIDGSLIIGAQPYSVFKAAIDQALAAQ